MKTLALIAVVATLAFAGCGGDDVDAAPAELPVEEAVDHEGPASVSGNLLAVGDVVRLCSALAESFPPQCGGASLLVAGLDLTQVEGLIRERDVSWTDRPTELLGVVRDGTLTVSENVQQ